MGGKPVLWISLWAAGQNPATLVEQLLEFATTKEIRDISTIQILKILENSMKLHHLVHAYTLFISDGVFPFTSIKFCLMRADGEWPHIYTDLSFDPLSLQMIHFLDTHFQEK